MKNIKKYEKNHKNQFLQYRSAGNFMISSNLKTKKLIYIEKPWFLMKKKVVKMAITPRADTPTGGKCLKIGLPCILLKIKRRKIWSYIEKPRFLMKKIIKNRGLNGESAHWRQLLNSKVSSFQSSQIVSQEFA